MQMCKFGIEFTGENVNPTLFKNYLFPLAMQKFGVASWNFSLFKMYVDLSIAVK